MSKKNEWYEVTAVFNKEDQEPRDIQGNHVYIRGETDNMMIIQVPGGVNHQQILQGVQYMLDKENIQKGVFVVDHDIELMRLESVDKAKARVMEAKYQQVRMQRMANASAPRTSQ